MPVRKLLDFDVVIESHDDSYSTRVVASPAGEAQAGFVLPFTDKDLRILVLEIVGSIGRQRRNVRRIETPERQLVEDFGDQLFRAVFSGQVGECLGRSRMTADSKGAGLRIRLRLPGTLVNIPWEYLYDAEHGFLSLDPQTALVRYPEMPAPVRPFAITPPLRILAMISAPSDAPELDSGKEWDKLEGALGGLVRRGLVEVDLLESGTLAALHRPLRLNEYHVLHFIGHGGYDENAQDGALALEDANRKTRLVTGRDLGMMIRHPSLRLVVLNACEGARGSPDDPFGGVAQALVRHGIPAVIAMQFEISDPAALVFGQSFYQAIADGLPVDVATVEARRAMFAEGSEIEWATPVLYLRSRDGRVFAKGLSTKAEQKTRQAAEREAAEREAAEREAAAREAAEREAAEREAAEREAAEREAAEREAAEREAAEREAAERQAAERQEAEWRAERQAVQRREAEREARQEAEWRAERQAVERREAELQEAELQARQKAGRPVLVAGPIVMSVPLLIFSLSLNDHGSKPWSLVVLCSAILGCAVAAAEHRLRRRKILVWTVALEFFFAWFLVYAIYRLNIGHIHRISHHLPPLAILAAVGAIFSASLCIRALVRSANKRRPVHPLLPAFLICMTVGLCATSIGYAGSHYHSVDTLHNISPKFYGIGAVFIFVALLVNLLAPLLALVRRPHGS